MNYLDITRQNWTTIHLKFSITKPKHRLHTWKGEYANRPELWMRGEHARLYVPFSIISSAGYIDLHDGKIYPALYEGDRNKTDKVSRLKEVLAYLEEKAG